MRVRLLGTAAGGGFPQWNCACPGCARLRAGMFAGPARNQSQLAVSADGGATWYLLNASPDLRAQIQAEPALWPDPAHGPRHSPIQGAVCTNADIDHTLGLLLLRESQPLRIYCTHSVQRVLLEDNSYFGMLRQTESQTRWDLIEPGRRFELKSARDAASGIFIEPIALRAKFPPYVYQRPAQAARLDEREAVLGLVVEGPGGQRVGYFPGLGEITPELERVFGTCSALFIDGTFWDENELQRLNGSSRTATAMGHLPVWGEGGTVRRLADVPSLRQTRKIFVHINNTNPMLDEAGDEFKRVRAAGWEVARDGLELRL